MENSLNILILGDIIGTPGMEQLMLKLATLKNKEKIDFIIANGENADDGFGLTEQNIKNFFTYGVNVITSGNHIWANKEAANILNSYDNVLRPANYATDDGKGYCITEVQGVQVGVVNLIGRYFMTPVDCPFQTLNKLLKNELKNCKIIITDFHAESSVEKQSLAFDFDGKVSLVVGTHTHVQTADEKILPNGTGYITDLGMCGSIDSVIGMDKDNILLHSTAQVVVPYTPATGNGRIQGIIAKVSTNEKSTINIKRFNI